MKPIIREATLEELASVNDQIEEFGEADSLTVIKDRLKGRRYLGLVAEDSDQLLGFKIGYELEDYCFYSWLGGVPSAHRGKGIARALLLAQEAWLREQGYREVRVKSRNRFRAMLTMLLGEGYLITGVESVDDVTENRIWFSKLL